MFQVYRVRGDSMQPTLSEGDYLVAFNRFVSRFFKPRKGQVVIIDHPKEGVMVKRVKVVNRNGFSASGDNVAESISTQSMGFLDPELFIGKVLFAVKRGSRIRIRL